MLNPVSFSVELKSAKYRLFYPDIVVSELQTQWTFILIYSYIIRWSWRKKNPLNLFYVAILVIDFKENKSREEKQVEYYLQELSFFYQNFLSLLFFGMRQTKKE